MGFLFRAGDGPGEKVGWRAFGGGKWEKDLDILYRLMDDDIFLSICFNLIFIFKFEKPRREKLGN